MENIGTASISLSDCEDEEACDISAIWEIIIEDVRKSIEDAQETVKLLSEEDVSECNAVYSSVLTSINKHSIFLDNWVNKHEELVQNTEESPEQTLEIIQSISNIQMLSTVPLQHSQLINLLQLWKTQRRTKWISSNLDFGNKLAESYINALNIRVKPIVVFTQAFSMVEAGSYVFFGIPFAYRTRYEKWPSMAHELGHLYLKMNADWNQESLQQLLINRLLPVKKSLGSSFKNYTERVVGLSRAFNIAWIPEFFADYVALAVCGPAFVTELFRLSMRNPVDTVSSTHPPWKLRIQCVLEAVSKLGVDKDKFNRLLAPPRLPSPELDRVTSVFAGSDMAPDLVDWMESQASLRNIKQHWKDIIRVAEEYGRHKEPTDPLHTRFGALAFLSLTEDTTHHFTRLINGLDS